MNRTDLQQLARIRLTEAEILLAGQQYSGSYYLAGYAVECGLKACIARQTRRHDFPDKKTVVESYTHDLSILVRIAGLQRSLDQEIRNDPQGFAPYWTVVRQWSEQDRYSIIDQRTAQNLVEAISHRRHGVLRWLRRHW